MAELRAYRKLKALHPRAHFIRLESWTLSGISDVNGCDGGVEAWIECKEVRKPAKATTLIKPKVRRAQVSFESLRRRAGGRTFVALMVGKEFYLVPGKYIVELKEGLPLEAVKALSINPQELFSYVPV
jgi:hypothetical protein